MIWQGKSSSRSLRRSFRVVIYCATLTLLVACGGSSPDEAAQTEPTVRPVEPLQVAASFAAGVTPVSAEAAAEWVEVEQTGSGDGVRTSRFRVPLSINVAVGQIYIVRGLAYKIASVEASGTDFRVVTATLPELSEIFSELKLTGDLPLTPVVDPQQSSSSSELPGRMTIQSYRVPDWIPRPVSESDYDPATLLQIGRCFTVETDKARFRDGAEVVEPIGFKINFSCLRIQSDDAIFSGSLSGSLGVYSIFKFSEGFNLLQADTALSGLKQTVYLKGDIKLSAADRWKILSKVLRLYSGRYQFTVLVPTPSGLPWPVIITVWIPVDLVLSADFGISGSHEWVGTKKVVIEGATYTTSDIEPFKLAGTTSGTGALKASALLRPGVGIGIYGWIPFSFHPKVGLKGELSTNLLTGCRKEELKLTLGADAVLLPSTWKHIGRDPYEVQRTKELLAPIDVFDPLFLREIGNGCSPPEAQIVAYDALVRPPASYRDVTNGSVKVGAAISGLGVKLSGIGSSFADSFLWEVVGAFGQSVTVGRSPTYSVNASDLAAVPGGAQRIRLTVSNGGLSLRSSTAEVQIIRNLPPTAAGIARVVDGSLVLSSGSADADGTIQIVRWTGFGRSWSPIRPEDEVRIPLRELGGDAAVAGRLLTLIVLDNETAEARIDVPIELSPPKASVNLVMAGSPTLPIADGAQPLDFDLRLPPFVSFGKPQGATWNLDRLNLRSVRVWVGRAPASEPQARAPQGDVLFESSVGTCTATLRLAPNLPSASAPNTAISYAECNLPAGGRPGSSLDLKATYPGDDLYSSAVWTGKLDDRFYSGDLVKIDSVNLRTDLGDLAPIGAARVSGSLLFDRGVTPRGPVRVTENICWTSAERRSYTISVTDAGVWTFDWLPAEPLAINAGLSDFIAELAIETEDYYIGPPRVGGRICRGAFPPGS